MLMAGCIRYWVSNCKCTKVEKVVMVKGRILHRK